MTLERGSGSVSYGWAATYQDVVPAEQRNWWASVPEWKPSSLSEQPLAFSPPTYRTASPLRCRSQTPDWLKGRLDPRGRRTLDWSRCGIWDQRRTCPEGTASHTWTKRHLRWWRLEERRFYSIYREAGRFRVVHTQAIKQEARKLLTADTEAEDLLWVALVLHHLTIAEREVVHGVAVHHSQQPRGGVCEQLRQEHGGRHGSLPQAHFHPGPAAEHHRHVCGSGRKHGHTWWEPSSWR